MAKWVMDIIYSSGYLGIVFLMFVENVFPPIPSELIIPLAGFMVSKGQFTFIDVVVAGTIGSVLGSLPLYYIGKAFGEDRLTEHCRQIRLLADLFRQRHRKNKKMVR